MTEVELSFCYRVYSHELMSKFVSGMATAAAIPAPQKPTRKTNTPVFQPS